ncbi:MAG: hypothetical protein ACRD0N_05785 [Acidimicrobiales bacterium]
MADLMLQFRQEGQRPTLDEVRQMFGLEPGEVDEAYGVVPTDPSEGVYVVLVRPEAAEKVQGRLAARPPHPVEGLFGNPRVEATSPPEADPRA